MKLGKQISGTAEFSFEYFLSNGFIGCNCSKCSEKIIFNIEINKSGKPVEQITAELNKTILNQLIENKIINLKKDVIKGFGLSKYSLWYVDALYSILICKSCNSKFLAIFGMGEIQPTREQVQFKGIWELEAI